MKRGVIKSSNKEPQLFREENYLKYKKSTIEEKTDPMKEKILNAR